MLCEAGQPLLFGVMCMRAPLCELQHVCVCVCLCDEWDMLDLGQANLRNPWHPHSPYTCLYSGRVSSVRYLPACAEEQKD